VSTNAPAVSNIDANTLLVYVFDPPFGVKTGTKDGETQLRWTMVWINDSPAAAEGVVITDQVPIDTTYADGLVCNGFGNSIIHSCVFEPPSASYPRGRVKVVADIGSDPLATTADQANNEVTISFNVSVNDPTKEQAVENQGVLDYDADKDGINDFKVITDDPTALGGTDPTVFTFKATPKSLINSGQNLAYSLFSLVILGGALYLLLRSRSRTSSADKK
jgi:hypothetical protein